MENINEMMQEDLGASQESTLEQLRILGEKQIEKERELLLLQKKVKEKEEEVKDVKNREIPRIMNDLGLDDFSLKTGEKIQIKKSYFGSIKDNEEQFIEYLSKFELDDIVKNIVTISLDKNEAFKAKELVDNLEKMGFNLDHKRSIHASTLKSFIKERIEGIQELKDSYIEKNGIPCSQGDKGWNDYLEFARSRNQEHDLLFPKELCKAIVIEQSKIILPKKKR